MKNEQVLTAEWSFNHAVVSTSETAWTGGVQCTWWDSYSGKGPLAPGQ